MIIFDVSRGGHYHTMANNTDRFEHGTRRHNTWPMALLLVRSSLYACVMILFYDVF